MPLPVNPIIIAAFPFSQVISVVDYNAGTFGGTANAVWLKYTAAAPIIIGQYSVFLEGWSQSATLYLSDATTNVNSGPRVWWWYLTAGVYYIKVTRSPALAIANTVTIHVEQGAFATLPLEGGSIIINDDKRINTGNPSIPHEGYPYPSVAYTTDGTFLGFIPQVPAGEMGDNLPGGATIWHDEFLFYGQPLTLFDVNYNIVLSFDLPTPLVAEFPRITSDGTFFYILHPTTGRIYKVTSAGVVTGPIATITTITRPTEVAIGISRDATIMYWTDGQADGKIHRWSITTDLALSTLYTIPDFTDPGTGTEIVAVTPNAEPGEVIVQTDGTIVTFWSSTILSRSILLHISAAGALLARYEYDTANVLIDHISRTLSAATVNIWQYLDPAERSARFGAITLATGVISPTFDIAMASDGHSSSFTDNTLFVPANSCAMLTVLTNPAVGGIYKMVKDKRNDTIWIDFTPVTTEDVEIP